jgi:NitT/TauT family transport system substrate-binding protein
MTTMLNRRQGLRLLGAALATPALAQAQSATIKIGMSGWTGFAPLTLADRAGLFKKHGANVETVFIPQAQRLAALASGAVQAVATTVDSQIVWSTAVPLTQVLVLDRSHGGDGIAAKPGINSIVELRGKTIGVDGAGTTPYFVLVYILKKNGLSARDVRLVTLAPQPAANAFLAGQVEAASTYEPYLSSIRNEPSSGRILVTTLDYPIVVDTLSFPTEAIARNKDSIHQIVAAFFEALEMIKEKPDEANRIMGERVNQTAEAFGKSASFIQWQDKAMNQAYMAKDLMTFMQEAADIQLDAGVIRQKPNLGTMLDTSFVA